MLQERPGYKFFSTLDIRMCYCTFELEVDSQELCTIITPYSKFCYNRLPMGISCAPDMCQEIMENLFSAIEDAEFFINDIGCFSNSWEQHLLLLEKVLTTLQDNGFMVNLLKCEWGVQETDWLGYGLTPVGLKPWEKKVNGILNLQ